MASEQLPGTLVDPSSTCWDLCMPAQSDLRFTFSAGSDDFEVVEFHLREGLSETFRLDVDLACTNPAVDFGEILDRPALFTLWQLSLIHI